MAHHPHQEPRQPSPWVVRFAPLIASTGQVLDVACGRGRHTRYLLALGHPVVAVDRDVSGVADLQTTAGVEVVQADLEDGSTFPLAGRSFSAVVVTNYLHRPLFGSLVAAVGPGGVLIYETYARGNERFGGPSDPDFLLAPGELWEAVSSQALRVVAYEDLVVDDPRPATVQRICAIRER